MEKVGHNQWTQTMYFEVMLTCSIDDTWSGTEMEIAAGITAWWRLWSSVILL